MKAFCLIFVNAIALVNVAVGFRQAWMLFRKKIRVCPGVIVSSRLDDADETVGEDDKLRVYWPVVKYEYEADGIRRNGDRISIAVIKTSVRREAERRLGPYPVGKEVCVFYNADDASEAWLNNPRDHIPTMLGWAFFMTTFAAAMDFMIWKLLP